MRALYPVQEQHAERLMKAIDKSRAALDASSTGCGKTLVGSQIAFEYDFPTLVVCPKTAVPMWERELDDRKVAEWFVINYESLRTGKTDWGTWKDARKKQWKWSLPSDTFLIWDECHRGKGMNSQNARMMWTAKPYRNLLLSATAAKDPTEMKALGYLLGLHSLRDFWTWCLRNGCTPGQFGGLDYIGADEDKPDPIDQIHKYIFPNHGSRLTRADLADHFQETQIILTPLDFGPEIQQVYEEMERELAHLATTQANDNKGAEALTIRLRARQKIELLKVPEMVNRTEDLLAEGLSVALFVNFTATIDALRARISVPSGVVSGAHGDRQKWMDKFQADEIRVIVNNVQAGGEMISLHDLHGNYPRVSLISPSDNEKQIIQILGRIDRAGGKTETQQHVLFAAGTVEEKVKDNCLRKIVQLDIFNKGIDGLEEKWETEITT